MPDKCPKCGMTYPDETVTYYGRGKYCDSDDECAAVAAAYQRGVKDGRSEVARIVDSLPSDSDLRAIYLGVDCVAESAYREALGRLNAIRAEARKERPDV